MLEPLIVAQMSVSVSDFIFPVVGTIFFFGEDDSRRSQYPPGFFTPGHTFSAGPGELSVIPAGSQTFTLAGL